MKQFRFFSVAAVALTALMMTSCKKDEPSSPEPTPYTGEVNYLVMFYAVGGGNLDGGQMANIGQALSYGSTDKVKMTFQYKLSAGGEDYPEYQKEPAYANFNGTRRFTLDQNVDLKGYFKDTVPSLTNQQIAELCEKINSTRIGDAEYVMSSDTALTSFINWSHKLYPNAKNVILVLGNHGGGWDLLDDGKTDYSTKGINYDDNNDNLAISLKGIERGVSSSDIKKVKMIYTDACLMAVYENLFSYSHITDYALTAVELTPGRGGEYMHFLGYLNEAGADAASLWDNCKKYINYLNETYWIEEGYHDLGIYDLTKIGTMTAPIKAITDSLVKKWNDTTTIPGKEGFNKWMHYIRAAVPSCELFNDTPNPLGEKDVPGSLVSYLVFAKEGKYYNAIKIIEWFTSDSSSIKEAVEKYPEDVEKLAEMMKKKSHDSYCLPDMLRVLNDSLKAGGVPNENNPFIALRNNYLATLKSISYINCTKIDTELASESDYPYEFTGPGIFLSSLNAGVFGKEKYHKKYGNTELGDAISYYTNTDFDAVVKWSNFLKSIDVTTSMLTNPMRGNLKK